MELPGAEESHRPIKNMLGNSASRMLEISDVDQAALVISQAFVDDPLCTFMLPNQRTRMKTLRKFFCAYGEIYIRNQCGYGMGEPLKGVAFWMAPDRPDISISFHLLGLFIPLLFTHYPIGYLRARSIIKHADVLHQRYASEPHYYLDNIGVLPTAHGQGVASGLIHPFLNKADGQGVSVYTDTVTRSNVSLYEHFGFKCMEELADEGTGITIWALLRPNG